MFLTLSVFPVDSNYFWFTAHFQCNSQWLCRRSTVPLLLLLLLSHWLLITSSKGFFWLCISWTFFFFSFFIWFPCLSVVGMYRDESKLSKREQDLCVLFTLTIFAVEQNFLFGMYYTFCISTYYQWWLEATVRQNTVVIQIFLLHFAC